MKKVAIIVLVLLLIAGGIFAFMKLSGNDDTSNNTSTNSTQSPGQESSEGQTGGSTITYDGKTFSPAKLTVKVGTNITITNNSKNNLQFDSDPHPVHTDNPELNVEVVQAGQSRVFTVTNVGTFGYHNHLDSSQTGTIVVQ